jgi:hypothetical protein
MFENIGLMGFRLSALKSLQRPAHPDMDTPRRSGENWEHGLIHVYVEMRRTRVASGIKIPYRACKFGGKPRRAMRAQLQSRPASHRTGLCSRHISRNNNNSVLSLLHSIPYCYRRSLPLLRYRRSFPRHWTDPRYRPTGGNRRRAPFVPHSARALSKLQ